MQPLHVKRFRESSSLMLNRSLTRLARAACCLAVSGSFGASATADAVSFLTTVSASFRAVFRFFTSWEALAEGLNRVHGALTSVKLSFVLAESALETVPREIQKSPSVVSDSRRRGVGADRILLDRSVHHEAMKRLRDSEKRGRPDLVHVTLLSVTGTPMYLDGSVKIYVHTNQDVVLEVGERTMVPKSYFRFRGLVEKLLSEGPEEGLVRAHRLDMKGLLKKVSADRVYGLSIQGKRTELGDLARDIGSRRNPCVVVGGFPHGHFSAETLGRVDELVRIHGKPLEAHVVAARVVYELEKATARTND